jgi:hypothetical protein
MTNHSGSISTRQPSGRLLVAAVLGAAAAFSAHGAVFSFTGTVFGILDTGTFLADSIQAGQALSGTISYSPANVTDVFLGDPNNGVYRFTGAALGEFSMTVNLVTPGQTYVFTSVVTPVNQFNNIQVMNPVGSSHLITYTAGDPLLDAAALPATHNGSLMSLDLYDSTQTALVSDAVPTIAPSLASFDNVTWNLFGYDTGGVQVYGLSANITSITPVPEPGEWALIAGGGLGVFALMRRRLVGSR